MTLLKVENLSVEFPTADGRVHAVHDISFEVNAGETLAIVGESGSGKTVTNLALMGLIPLRTADVTGSAKFESHGGVIDLIKIDRKELQKYRGRDVAMIFQDPMSSLHPFYSIGDQIIEAHQIHNQVDLKVSKARAIELLELVGIQGAAERIKSFPHQFSGGMRQRVMIAMALVNNPSLLIADEPTTALDVTIQAQIMTLLKELQRTAGKTFILITHNMALVSEVADHVAVMYLGRVVEYGTVDQVLRNPKHPYTRALLQSVPTLEADKNIELQTVEGQTPSPADVTDGCEFAGRCPYAIDSCQTGTVEMRKVEPGHDVRCLRLDELGNLPLLTGSANNV